MDMCHVGAQEAAEFLRKIDQKESTDVFVISVTQALIDTQGGYDCEQD